ncbi:MAG: MMPL family transporter, partial [Ilumatobacteraceae bacterium]
MLRQLATFAVRRKKTMVLGIWLPLVIIISFVSNSVGDGFRTEMELPNSDARDAQEMISKVSPSDGGESSQIVIKTTSSIDDETTKTALNAALAEVAKIPRIRVLSPYDVPTQVNPARTIAFAQVTTPEDMSMEEMTVVAEEIKDITASLRTTSGVTIEYGGQLFRVFAMPESEALGLLAAIIILVLAFGSVIAMGLPIGIALLGLAAASGIVVIVSNLMSMPSEATSMVAMIGLGVGIDYALFIVTRYREALHDGMSVEDSIVESIDTSGRAVLFAGITVVVALLGLLSIGLAFVSGFS